MKDYKPAMSFDEDVARLYLDFQRGDEIAAVAFLEQLAGRGPALELGIGTGRIALPLAARGLRVDGVELSPAMVEQLRARPGGDRLAVTVGDLADVPVPGSYRLIYVIFNTLFNLLTQDEQVRCFENVAAHLADDGVFVIEAYVPTFLYRLRNDQYVDAESIQVDEVRLDLLRHDAVTQVIEESHVSLTREGIRLNPVVQRYAWPSELDLMARLAGLRLKTRWAGWTREPFTSGSDAHVSVYER
ncbi:MAG: class I SAM-dependent methyltransferase [Anaerolineae bacterium]|nr:class I SAM-dependent methyltransferase [Anaerolineae bacterium]